MTPERKRVWKYVLGYIALVLFLVAGYFAAPYILDLNNSGFEPCAKCRN